MTFSIKRVRAIITKDWKDLIKNYYILISILLPLGFAFMISRLGTNDASMLSMPINIALVMTGAFVQASMMAEEKEKSTLRVLLLSPATTLEIMMGKSVLSAVITSIVVAGSIIISGIKVPGLFFLSIMIILSLIIFISLGTIIGLISRTVMETSIVGLPILVIFIYGSVFGSMFDSSVVTKIITYLPTENFSAALMSLQGNGGFSEVKWNIVNLLIWAIFSVILAIFIYGKRRFDK
ncbi:MAG: ABC transporter permease [Candidatus Pristimantibacillus lignocellulolyticus]|uniref:ABC transporter permease n=1 Tax=Candidatus Pristimantibacillus lignocellulolyticus TaxID=2994561 RepID=A0A9J6ZJ48_9BACL|nr:MAG: ABC transporter permease [Candidatus Pristimantibacillus lignocellulolyticus]